MQSLKIKLNWSADMKSKENNEKRNKSNNNSKNLLTAFYQNHASELKFIVPWALYNKSDLKNCKNKIVQ